MRKGADVQIYGSGGTRRSSRIQRMSLSGANFAYDVEAGPLYDNGVVLPIINWKANAISECELIMEQFDSSKGKWVREIEKGVIADVLAAFDVPNDYYDGITLWHGIQLSWSCRGNAYMLNRYDKLGRLIGFYWCPHFQIRPLSDGPENIDGTKLITSYEYTPFNGYPRSIPIESVTHLRYGIDPKDPACGLSPLAAVLREVCADNEISTWIASILRQGGTPGAILVPKVDTGGKAPTDPQKRALRELWQQFVGDRRGEAFMSPLPIEVITPTWSPQQLELGKMRDIPMARIFGAEGIDPMVLGYSSERQTFANKEMAIDDAGKRSILPAIRRWTSQAGRQVLPQFKLDPRRYRLSWDTGAVSWLRDERDALHKRVRDDYRFGVLDRYAAKEQLGQVPDESDRGVYATDVKALPESDAPDSQAKALRLAIATARERRKALESSFE